MVFNLYIKLMKKLLFISLGILFTNLISANDTLFVKFNGVPFTSMDEHQSWATATRDLQQAIDSLYSVGGGQIWVSSGFYFPDAGTDRTNSFYPRNNVAVYGGFGGIETSIEERLRVDRDGNDSIEPWEFFSESVLSGNIGDIMDSLDNSYHVLDGTGTDSTAVFDGFRIMDGHCELGYMEGGAGANSAQLNNCVLENNYGSDGGAVRYCVVTNSMLVNNKGVWGGASGSSYLVNCRLINNSAFQGGASVKDTLFNCILDSNAAGQAGGGGAAYSTLYNCIVSNNTSTGDAGGLSAGLTNPSCAVNCIIYNNSAAEWGGGSAYYNLDRCIVMNNKASVGGGVQQGRATNCLIANNYATSINGGSGHAVLTNCTVVNNSTEGSPYSVNCAFTGNIWNSVFWNSYIDYSDTYGVYYCASNQPGFETNYESDQNIQLPNDNEEGVRFVDPTDSIGLVKTPEGLAYIQSGNWSLQTGSLCVDAGTNNYLGDTMITDLAGFPRIFNSIIDMGSYECQESTEPPINAVHFNNEDADPQFCIFPSITHNIVHIHSISPEVKYDIQIFNITGNYVKKYENLIGDQELDLGNLQTGSYYLCVIDEFNKAQVQNIIINH